MPQETKVQQHYSYVIVGTGFSGLSVAWKLQDRGYTDFVILDQGAEPGGTWRDNSYPGVACDIPSHVYSFSFYLNPNWSKFFAPGEEIQQYVRDFVRDTGLESKIHTNTEMLDATWNEDTSQWVIQTNQGVYTCDYFISAAGSLVKASFPNIPGLDTFPGEKMHTSLWDHEVDLKGKRVAVIGTGASAIQVVPEMVDIASSVVVFQRTPAWVRARPDFAYTEAQKRAFARDEKALRRHRENIFWTLEQGFAARRNVKQFKDQLYKEALTFLEKQVTDPELRAKLTPDYEIGCKRVLFSNRYYPAIADEKTTLEASALVAIDGNVLTAASGETYEVDAIVFATGFDASEPPYPPLIHNGRGESLADHWHTGMRALDSITVAGFPNLFVINGPNTSLGHNSTVHIVESQADYVVDTIDYMQSHDEQIFEAKQAEEDSYIDSVDATAEGSIWLAGGCQSWYIDDRSGRLTTIYPDSAQYFRHQNSRFNPAKYTFRTPQPA